jgi:ribosome-associated protein
MKILDAHIKMAVTAAEDKKAEDIVVLDVSEVCTFSSTLVICHGNSSRQVQTIAGAIRDLLRENGLRPHHVEGERQGEWVLMDYLYFVVHIFSAERRQFYALEHLWGDAPRVDITSEETGPVAGS